MARTFTCNEEIIVVSKGTEDIGKLAMLGNSGKFDPSVIPSTENKPVCCRVTRSSDQSVPATTTSSGTMVIFDTVEFDSDKMFDTVNPSRLVVPSDGVYQVVGQVKFIAQANASARSISVLVNGSIFIGSQATTTNGVNTYGLNIGSIYKFKKGDYVELGVYQFSGETIKIISDTKEVPALSIYKISE